MNDIREGKKLAVLKKEGLYREDFRYLSSEQAPRIRMDGRDIILLGSNSYLGLCGDARMKEAAIWAVKRYGVGAGGSRLTTGSYDLHQKLEKRLSQLKGTEASLVFSSGYMANMGILSALCDKSWVIFCDKLNHASIVDGCLLSGAKLVRYKHCSVEDLERKIHQFKGEQNIIVTDGVFSMDGDIAPLQDIVRIARANQILTMVDDAHGLGVLGDKGAGTSSHFALSGEIDIEMGTLSKAVASVGGYVAGKGWLIDYLRNCSRSFIFSTALPPASIAVSLKALDIIQRDAERRNFLKELSQWFKGELAESGFYVMGTITPIIPVVVGTAEKAVLLSERLLEDGIYVPAIRPPTVPLGTSRLRISLMATHTHEELSYVLERIRHHGKKLGIIEG